MTEITILGAGIAGLAAATSLGQRGFGVRVLEQAPAITEVGAGLQISPNGAAVLRALGLGDALSEGGVKAQAVELIDGRSGRRVVRFPLDHKEYYLLHRADLIEMLRRRAVQEGAKIDLGRVATGVTAGDRSVDLTFADGTEIKAQTLIGADGVHSVARAALGSTEPAQFTRQVAWRALVPNPADTDPVARVHMGPGKHIVHYPLAGGRLMNIVAIEERDEWTADGWNFADDSARLRAAFMDFALPVRDLLAAVEDVHLWGLHKYPVLEKWTEGGLCLIGDAAHPTLPFLGQGANMGLEDAWVLADCLAGGVSDKAFARFEALRKPRATKIVQAAQQNARNYHLGGLQRHIGHAGLRAIGSVAPGVFLKTLNWIYDHDVTAQSAR